jgi:hypothetical protein
MFLLALTSLSHVVPQDRQCFRCQLLKQFPLKDGERRGAVTRRRYVELCPAKEDNRVLAGE